MDISCLLGSVVSINIRQFKRWWKINMNGTMKKEYDIKELENSKRIFKSATPKYTVDWYLKWIASIFVLCGMSIRGIPELQSYDLILSSLGVFLWLIVSFLWRDRALILLNGLGLMFLIKNLITNLLWKDIKL